MDDKGFFLPAGEDLVIALEDFVFTNKEVMFSLENMTKQNWQLASPCDANKWKYAPFYPNLLTILIRE